MRFSSPCVRRSPYPRYCYLFVFTAAFAVTMRYYLRALTILVPLYLPRYALLHTPCLRQPPDLVTSAAAFYRLPYLPRARALHGAFTRRTRARYFFFLRTIPLLFSFINIIPLPVGVPDSPCCARVFFLVPPPIRYRIPIKRPI